MANEPTKIYNTTQRSHTGSFGVQNCCIKTTTANINDWRVAHIDRTIKIWNLIESVCLLTHSKLNFVSKGFKVLDFLNNKAIASGSADETIQIWKNVLVWRVCSNVKRSYKLNF